MAAVQSTQTDDAWRVDRVPLNKLYLVELRHVSQGSWQPVIAYTP